MALITDARDLKIDKDTGDLVIENGDLVQVSGIDAIAQAVRQHLSFFKGEWFLDEEEGLPYFEEVLVKNPNLAAIQDVFRKEILSIAGILEVQSLTLAYVGATRTLKVSFRASTDLGELTQTEELSLP